MYLFILLTVAGVLTHYLKQVISAKERGEDTSLLKYWTTNPYKTTLSVIGTFILFVITYNAGQMTDVAAFSIGVMGNSAADLIGGKIKNTIGKGSN